MSAARPDLHVVVVMPAHNAARTLAATVASIPRDEVDEVLLVDDSSSDDTLAIAAGLEIATVWHPHNAGYGANQKTCYLEALRRGADVVVMLHPDGQYAPDLIPRMVEPIAAGRADLVLGSRLLDGVAAARDGGMPWHKIVANRGLTGIQNRIMGTRLAEGHTGYRAYSRRLLLELPWLRNSIGFSFDSELLFQTAHLGFAMEEVACRTRYFDEASSIALRPASVYALRTVWAGARLVLHRRGLRSPLYAPGGRSAHPPPTVETIGDTDIPPAPVSHGRPAASSPAPSRERERWDGSGGVAT